MHKCTKAIAHALINIRVTHAMHAQMHSCIYMRAHTQKHMYHSLTRQMTIHVLTHKHAHHTPTTGQSTWFYLHSVAAKSVVTRPEAHDQPTHHTPARLTVHTNPAPKPRLHVVRLFTHSSKHVCHLSGCLSHFVLCSLSLSLSGIRSIPQKPTARLSRSLSLLYNEHIFSL